MRSSAIQGVQNGSEKAARPPEGCPAETGSLFGPESALGFDRPSGTNARRPSQKAKKRWPSFNDHQINNKLRLNNYFYYATRFPINLHNFESLFFFGERLLFCARVGVYVVILKMNIKSASRLIRLTVVSIRATQKLSGKCKIHAHVPLFSSIFSSPLDFLFFIFVRIACQSSSFLYLAGSLHNFFSPSLFCNIPPSNSVFVSLLPPLPPLLNFSIPHGVFFSVYSDCRTYWKKNPDFIDVLLLTAPFTGEERRILFKFWCVWLSWQQRCDANLSRRSKKEKNV